MNDKLKLTTTLFLGLISSVLGSSRVPSMYGGKCAIVMDSLYFLGGQINTDPANTTKLELNRNVYKLDLVKDTQVNQFNEADWQTIEGVSNAPEALFPAVVAESDSSPNIFMFGGQTTKFEDAFQTFDTSSSKWLDTSSINKIYPPIRLSNNQTAIYSFFHSTFLRAGGGDYIHFGGMVYKNDKSSSEARASIGVYNSNKKAWSWPQNSGTRVYSHIACIYQSTMYVIGGLSFETLKPFPMETIMTYDIPRARWTNQTAKGDIPSDRVGASSVMVDNLLYMVGGSDDFNFKGYPGNELNILDLKTLTWTKKEILDFKPTYLGCLAYYKGNLIYSFGYHGGYSSSTQFIDVANFKVVNKLVDGKPAAKDVDIEKKDATKDGDTKDKSNDNLPAIIGGSVGGALGLVAIIVAIIFWRRRNNKGMDEAKSFNDANLPYSPQPAYSPPEMLKGNVWSDGNFANMQSDNEVSFSLNTATQMPDFDNTLMHSTASDTTKANRWN